VILLPGEKLAYKLLSMRPTREDVQTAFQG